MIKPQLENSESTTNSKDIEEPSHQNKMVKADITQRAYMSTTTNNSPGDEWKAKVKNEREKRIREFARSKREETQGFIENGTFKVRNIDDTEDWTRIFGSRFVDTIKLTNVGVRYKRPLVAQNCGEKEAATIVTKVSTVLKYILTYDLQHARHHPSINAVAIYLRTRFLHQTTNGNESFDRYNTGSAETAIWHTRIKPILVYDIFGPSL